MTDQRAVTDQNAKVVSYGHYDESSGKPRGGSTNQSSPIDLLCIFSVYVCVYTRSFYRTRTVVGISICIRYPPTIESNPGFLQNCNFLRFHAFRGKQYLSRLHVKSIKMRRYVLFYLGKVYCALSSFSFFFIFDEIRNVR